MKRLNKKSGVVPEIDLIIKKKFQINTGIRSKEEDLALYQTVYDRLFSELLKFLEEELSFMNKVRLIRDLDRLDKAIPDDKRKNELIYTQLFRYLSYIPFGTFKLERRLDHLVENMQKENSKI